MKKRDLYDYIETRATRELFWLRNEYPNEKRGQGYDKVPRIQDCKDEATKLGMLCNEGNIFPPGSLVELNSRLQKIKNKANRSNFLIDKKEVSTFNQITFRQIGRTYGINPTRVAAFFNAIKFESENLISSTDPGISCLSNNELARKVGVRPYEIRNMRSLKLYKDCIEKRRKSPQTNTKIFNDKEN